MPPIGFVTRDCVLFWQAPLYSPYNKSTEIMVNVLSLWGGVLILRSSVLMAWRSVIIFKGIVLILWSGVM